MNHSLISTKFSERKERQNREDIKKKRQNREKFETIFPFLLIISFNYFQFLYKNYVIIFLLFYTLLILIGENKIKHFFIIIIKNKVIIFVCIKQSISVTSLCVFPFRSDEPSLQSLRGSCFKTTVII